MSRRDIDCCANCAKIVRAWPRRNDDEIGLRNNLGNRRRYGRRRVNHDELESRGAKFSERARKVVLGESGEVR